MPTAMTKVYLQPLLVDSGSQPPKGSTPSALYKNESGSYAFTRQVAPNVSGPGPMVENRIVKMTFSSVPVVSQWELVHNYQELGEALSEMTELEEGDDWKIDPPVYTVARYIATELMANAFPAPNVFSHGPKSVVFNWERGTRTLYLTVSADRISALVSSPERINRRMEISYSANELLDSSHLLAPIRAAQLEEPVALAVPSGSSDSPEGSS